MGLKRINVTCLLFFALCADVKAQSPLQIPAVIAETAKAGWEKTAAELWESAQQNRRQREYQTAFKFGQSVLAIEETLYGKDHVNSTGTVQFFAECHEAIDQLALAKSFREDHLRRVVIAYGPTNYRVTDAKLALKHVRILESLSKEQRQELANARHEDFVFNQLYLQGRFDDAGKLEKRILELRRRILGDEHPDTAFSLNSLGLILEKQEKIVEAEPLITLALKINENLLGREHPTVATNLTNLAKIDMSLGRYDAAEKHYMESLKINESVFGPLGLETALVVNNLAQLYQERGNYEPAEALLQRALKIRVASFGDDHPETAMILNNLCTLYERRGDYEKALSIAGQVLKTRSEKLDPWHHELGSSYNNMAHVHYVR